VASVNGSVEKAILAVEPGVELPSGARVQLIGDAVVPRRVAHAIAEGRAAADAILAGSGAPAFRVASMPSSR
jgi:hypothetical protein